MSDTDRDAFDFEMACFMTRQELWRKFRRTHRKWPWEPKLEDDFKFADE